MQRVAILVILLGPLGGCGFISLSALHPEKTPSKTYDPRRPLSREAATVPPNILGQLRHRNAVLIGISEYRAAGSGLSNLTYASSDADAICTHLLESRFNCVRVLTNERAQLADTRRVIREMVQQSNEDDLVLISWAGHCCPDPNNPSDLYLVAYDTDLRSLPQTGYSLSDFRSDVLSGKSRRLLVVVDTCHAGGISGQAAGSETSQPANPDMLVALRGVYVREARPRLVDAGTGTTLPVELQASPESVMRLVFSACQQGESSGESADLEHGVFTYYLLKGLQGAADARENGGNGDSTVTLDEAIRYTGTEVRKSTRCTQNPAIAGKYEPDIPMGIIKK